MAINSCALIEPALAESGIHADGQDVLVADVDKIGEVRAEGGVSAEIFADVMAVEHDDGMAKHAIKVNYDALARGG